MKTRYSVKRGKRSEAQYDVLVRDQGKLVFYGSFIGHGNRKLRNDELRIIAAIKQSVEELT